MAAIATEDARFRQSSQFRLWSFSPAKLADLRTKSNTLAKTHISARLKAGSPNEPLPAFLTPDEETLLLKLYTVDLLRAAAFCELPTEIRATAAIFLRRFYVTNSIMMYPPRNLLKTCLFFGAKGEGFYTRLSKFAEKFPNTTAEEIVAGEFLLCQGIRFAFDVRHPFRALEGVILELRRLYPDESKRIERAHARAREVLKFSPLMTDAYFHYTPSQIMFAALSMADEDLVNRFLGIVFKNGESSAGGTEGEATAAGPTDVALGKKIANTIQNCRTLLESERPERMDEYWGSDECKETIRPLVKKLTKCRDPDRIDLVALQRTRRELASRKTQRTDAIKDGAIFGAPTGGLAADSRDNKRRKMLDDPFGPSIQ